MQKTCPELLAKPMTNLANSIKSTWIFSDKLMLNKLCWICNLQHVMVQIFIFIVNRCINRVLWDAINWSFIAPGRIRRL